MSKKCLDCAKRQQIKGWRVAREAYSVLWPVLMNNKTATLELNEKQMQGLLDVTEEMTSIICGAEKSGMNIAEYAEHITGKADECRAWFSRSWASIHKQGLEAVERREKSDVQRKG